MKETRTEQPESHIEQKDSKEAYREAIEMFKEKYPDAFRVLDIGGVHPEKRSKIENPYMDGEIDDEDFRNVGEHNVAVGMCAQKIVDRLVQKEVLSPEQADQIVGRALIHDANKRFEVMRKKAKRAGRDIDVYSEKGYESMFDHIASKDPEVAHKFGAYLKSAGMETGHTSLKDFITINEKGEPYIRYKVQLPEMIVHLADDMTSSIDGKTTWVTIEERMKNSRFEERYPFLYKEGFGFDEDGNVIYIDDCAVANGNVQGIRTYAEWQKLVAKLISEEIAWMLEEKGDAEQIVKDIANK